MDLECDQHSYFWGSLTQVTINMNILIFVVPYVDTSREYSTAIHRLPNKVLPCGRSRGWNEAKYRSARYVYNTLVWYMTFDWQGKRPVVYTESNPVTYRVCLPGGRGRRNTPPPPPPPCPKCRG